MEFPRPLGGEGRVRGLDAKTPSGGRGGFKNLDRELTLLKSLIIGRLFSRPSRPVLSGCRRHAAAWWLISAALLILAGRAFTPLNAAETIPAPPTRYFNDYALLVRPETAGQLNNLLENFEKTNSSQVLVAIFPRMSSDSSIEDYTVRVAQKWGVGQKGKNNGAVLFVFVDDHKMFLQVGYGLEAVLPDAIAKDITENLIKPRFKAGDYDGGLVAGVNAILRAIGGEYRGTGRTVAQGQARGGSRRIHPLIPLLVFLAFMILVSRRSRRGTVFGPLGPATWGGWSGGGWGSGSSWGGGGRGGGGGSSSGSFSGGGGSFGGGGAGSSW